MAKQTKTFRLSEECVDELLHASIAFGMTETATLELCVQWIYESGLYWEIQESMRRTEIDPRALVKLAMHDGEIMEAVKAKFEKISDEYGFRK